LPLFIDAPRVDNAIHYLSPIFSGFRVQGMVALGENVMDRYQGLKASYAQGPLNLAAAYEQSKASAPPPGTPSTVNKVLEFGGNYNFGPATAYAGYQRGRDLTTGPRSQIQIGTLTLPGLTGGPATRLSAYTLGGLVPVGVAQLMAEYTRTKFENATGAAITTGASDLA
jgi:predicted porin